MRKSARGFTLVELLVVISIIAILSVIGITIFSGIQKQARDAKRRGDIDAIAKAIESNRGNISGLYVPIRTDMFASGALPYDPLAPGVNQDPTGTEGKCGAGVTGGGWTSKCWYCLRTDTGQAGYCGTSGNDRYVDTFATGQNTIDTTAWQICANLETGTTKYYCIRSSQ